jgi:hypothetical protein
MNANECAYYVRQSLVSDPREFTNAIAALPADPQRLVEAVCGIVLHPLQVGWLGITPPREAADDVESRTVPKIVARILARDGAPLDVARPPERRFIGICRDYVMVACAALRHHGIPARARVGFATYFGPGFHDDHWVCEYHAGDRWRLLDPQLGARVRPYYKIAFSPTDVPRDAFLVAGETWRRVRSGAIDPSTCGVQAYGLIGEWFIGSNVLRDLAALNKREMLAWDSWGLSLEFAEPGRKVAEAAAVRLDAVAALTAGDPDWKAVRDLYEGDETLRVPSVVRSSGPGGPKQVPVSV